MDEYAGRVLADRYRLPLPPSDEYELTETRAFDTYSGQEVLVRQVPLPEVVEAEVLDAEGLPDGFTARDPRGVRDRRRGGSRGRRRGHAAARRIRRCGGRSRPRRPRRRIPDHPRLDQVFDVFAEGGSLWIVSELVAARPLAALLAEKPLTPYRAAEVASDVLMALRVLHAHGWVHRNITARTVLVCDDGRVMLTGPRGRRGARRRCAGTTRCPNGVRGVGCRRRGVRSRGRRVGGAGRARWRGGTWACGSGPAAPGGPAGPGGGIGFGAGDPEAARRAAIEAREAGGCPARGARRRTSERFGRAGARCRRDADGGWTSGRRGPGAIAAYRAGARAAARVQEAQQSGRAALPGARPAPEGTRPPRQRSGAAAVPRRDGAAQSPYSAGQRCAASRTPARTVGTAAVPRGQDAQASTPVAVRVGGPHGPPGQTA